MLAGDEYTHTFVNGTIYQAFLNALSYHRWHSPVSGTVVTIHHQPGTYYAEDYWEGFGKSGRYPHPHTRRLSHGTGHEADPSGPNKSQAYLSEVATRAMIYTRADDPSIGLVCALFIGIAEVSSCEVTVKTGQHVMGGDEIGMFHYGGSTYCLLFQAGVDLDFVDQADPEFRRGSDVNVRVCSEIARVRLH
jgi:phosphatidylserine decarboxylase